MWHTPYKVREPLPLFHSLNGLSHVHIRQLWGLKHGEGFQNQPVGSGPIFPREIRDLKTFLNTFNRFLKDQLSLYLPTLRPQAHRGFLNQRWASGGRSLEKALMDIPWRTLRFEHFVSCILVLLKERQRQNNIKKYNIFMFNTCNCSLRGQLSPYLPTPTLKHKTFETNVWDLVDLP